MPDDFQRDKLLIRGSCGAEVESNGQRVGLLSQSALHGVDDVNPDLKFGMPQPSVGKLWAVQSNGSRQRTAQ